MNTRAKFKCVEVAKRDWGSHQVVFAAKFQVVYGDNEENKKFFAATPAGSIEISTVRDDFFEVGKEYFVDFIPAQNA